MFTRDRNPLILFAAIVLIFVIAGCGDGGTSKTPADTGKVLGYVTSDGTTPLSNVIVSDSSGQHTTVTSSTGAYTLNLPVGNKVVTFVSSGYSDRMSPVSVSSSSTVYLSMNMSTGVASISTSATTDTNTNTNTNTGVGTGITGFTTNTIINKLITFDNQQVILCKDGSMIDIANNDSGTWALSGNTVTITSSAGTASSYTYQSQYTSGGVVSDNKANVLSASSNTASIWTFLALSVSASSPGPVLPDVAGKTMTLRISSTLSFTVQFDATGTTATFTTLSGTFPGTYSTNTMGVITFTPLSSIPATITPLYSFTTVGTGASIKYVAPVTVVSGSSTYTGTATLQ